MKLWIALVLLSSLLLFGCVQQPAPTATPTAMPTATPAATATPTPEPVKYAPMALEYELGGFGGPEGQKAVFWLDKETDCNGKAYVGIVKSGDASSFASDDRTRWNKVAVYADGSSAISNDMSRQQLAFDSAKSRYQDSDVLLMLDSVFRAAGKDFATDPVWTSTTPTIIKNAALWNNMVNLSIIRGAETAKYAVPCTEFSLMFEGSGPSELKICAAKPQGRVPLPFTVHLAIPTGNGASMEMTLTKFSNEASTVPYYPQCLAPVVCKAVPQPTQEQMSACNARNATYEPIRDEINCITSYACKTLREQVIDSIAGSQSPTCTAPSEQMVSQALSCRDARKNWDATRGQQGCVTEIKCIG